MYTEWAGGIHLNCLSLEYRFEVSDLLWWQTRGDKQIKYLCEFYVRWLGNSKYKAHLFASAGKLYSALLEL